MRIECPIGTKVRFVDENEEAVRWSGFDNPTEYLSLGDVYTISAIRVGSWKTKVTLVECPCKIFNSVHFEEVEDDNE